MWRKTFALVSAVILTATMAATAVANSHPAAPVTAVPSTGVGLMPDQVPSLLLGLIGLAVLFAVLALTTMSREQRA